MRSERVTWPYFEEDEIQAVVDVLRSGRVNYWTGDEGRLFEEEFAAFCNCKYAIALANGSVALELALAGLGIGEGDEVIVTSRSFIASASAIIRCNAIPVFADVDAESQNITVETVKPLITGKTRAIIAVHLAGWPCEMDGLQALAQSNNLKIVEDCAQALGARYKEQSVGSFGDAAVFSFCNDKIMTTGGEGGMLVTDSQTLWSYAWSLKDHGKNYEEVIRKDHPLGFRWLHDSFGTNYRMTEMQSALGRVALKKVDARVKQRRRNAAFLNRFFKDFSVVRRTLPPTHVSHAYYKFYVFVNTGRLRMGWNRDRVMQEIWELGVPCYSGSCSEIYQEEAFSGTGLRPEKRLPTAKELGETSLMFQVDTSIDLSTLEAAAAKMRNILANAGK